MAAGAMKPVRATVGPRGAAAFHSDQLWRAKSPPRVKALTPILAFRPMDHWVQQHRRVLNCRMFQSVGRHLCTGTYWQQHQRLRQTANMRQQRWICADTQAEGAKSLHVGLVT